MAQAAIDRISQLMGGCILYIPKYDHHLRNTRIVDTFNGHNHDALCRRFSISRSTLYRIIKQC